MGDSIVNRSTGELIEPGAQAAVDAMLNVPPGLYGNPLGPGELASMIDEATQLSAHVGRVVTLLYERRHRAEETYQKAFAESMTKHARSGAVLARQFAIAGTSQELLDLNLAKEQLRYAEEMQQALKDRQIGLESINKRL